MVLPAERREGGDTAVTEERDGEGRWVRRGLVVEDRPSPPPGGRKKTEEERDGVGRWSGKMEEERRRGRWRRREEARRGGERKQGDKEIGNK